MMSTHATLGLAGWIGLTFLAPLAGFRARPDEWYRTLAKPSWNPPSWIFAPVWILLYTLMAISAWLVWRHGGWSEQYLPLGFYLTQLFLNALWTPLFFGAHRVGLALADIALMWLAILATLIFFSEVTPLAGWLLAPYLAWVTFASALNFAIFRRNR